MSKLIKVKNGVRLLEATLRSSVGVVAKAYTVKSARTPEARNFNTLVEAQHYFDREARQIALRQ